MVVTEKHICITCPMGCTLTVSREGETILNIEGNSCPRGVAYIEQELKDPRRMVATTVKVKGGLHPLVPVYTERPFPKPHIFALLDVLRQIELQAPVKAGDIVLEDALGTGIPIIASRDLPPAP